MLAYISWHRPAASVEPAAYEHALEQFHRSLAHQPPCGFRGSAAFRAPQLPWLVLTGAETTAPAAAETPVRASAETTAPDAAGVGAAAGPDYEDWYLLDDWAAVGVLEEAAVAHGHVSLHDRVAARAEVATGAVYRLVEGHARLGEARVAIWVARARGHGRPSLAALLGDGMDPACGCLWRRCLGLGPAPEYCLLAAEPPAGVGAGRLPKGWSASTLAREPLWHG
ncbi:MAG TPA: hypothetical protein VMF09_09815 [Solirubrobacteraceae bacterium]|nr:hypothetical protein [Solirubrobacteraceae bacterium]